MDEQKIIKSFLLADAEAHTICPEEQKAMFRKIMLSINKQKPKTI